jgi:putative ABC transport system permease protein
VSAFGRLVIRNALRNRRRTLLTVTSVAISIFLLVSLQTLLTEIRGDTLLSRQSERRLLTRSSTSLAIPLPLAYKSLIGRVDGVEVVSEYQWIPTYYKQPNIPLVIIACDPAVIGTDPDVYVPQRDIEVFRKDRRALIVPVKMAKKNGWKYGDKIVFPGTVFPFPMEFTIRGTFLTTAQNFMFCHFSYFNESVRQSIPSRADQSMAFIMRSSSPDSAPKIAAAIDGMFHNSAAPTRTESERNFVLGFGEMLGNVRLFISMIAVAVIFAIALVTTNTMSLAVRERAHEIAMMKAMGFTPVKVVGIILAESLSVSGAGAVAGVITARLFFATFDIYDLTDGVVQHFQITNNAIAQGLILAIAMALVSSLVPAVRGASRPIAASLRQIG